MSKMDDTIIIQNIQDYTKQILNGNLVLTRRNPFVDEAALFQKNLRGSTLLECIMNNKDIDIKKYKKLLFYIYSNTNIETILQNTTLNISQQEIYDKGLNIIPI